MAPKVHIHAPGTTKLNHVGTRRTLPNPHTKEAMTMPTVPKMGGSAPIKTPVQVLPRGKGKRKLAGSRLRIDRKRGR